MTKDMSLKGFICSSLTLAINESQEEIQAQKEMQKAYKAMRKKIWALDKEEDIKKMLGENHECFTAYERFKKGDFSDENTDPK
jgi:hypothetical protein